ncbi:GntR family transcriptional regulator [Salipiger mucosus]|uniref:Transcriptional regulator, GntR family n=1 Tax=Salipiger mucosus DSM 16094 TaxID=1123237 RepID=S9QRL4_9RHOB|nr:GntR family transcriptional regulator [Salipiger mucosus]EPX82278.1 transcriptional regulator, GntR family [Salipiger mucosus DSM 16094]
MQFRDMTADTPTLEAPRGTRSAFVTERVRDMITSGQLEPGSRINERVLVEQLNISRTPLREAFKILEREGLISIRPNVGATVVVFTMDDVEASIEVLIGLESIGAERAAERATEAEIAEISDLHDRMVAAFEAGELMTYFHINQDIHQKIIDAAHNPALSRVYAEECARIRRFRFAGNRDEARWTRAVHEHEQIRDALIRREGPLLRELLRAHHVAGWTAARRALEAEEAATGRAVAQ